MFERIERALLAVLCLAAIWAMSTPAVSANDDWDKKTTFTVNQPFEIPGNKVLPAGTYVVKIVDVGGDRSIVRFLSADETKVYATVIGIPDFRLKPAENPDISFYEAETGLPRPVHAWFYSGYQYGFEFVYPKKRAAEIAPIAEEHVLAMKTPEPFEPVREKPFPAPAELTVEELLEEPIVAIEPTGEELAIVEIHPELPLLELQAEPPAPFLPKTGTPLPLALFLGLLAAGAASGVRLLRR